MYTPLKLLHKSYFGPQCIKCVYFNLNHTNDHMKWYKIFRKQPDYYYWVYFFFPICICGGGCVVQLLCPMLTRHLYAICHSWVAVEVFYKSWFFIFLKLFHYLLDLSVLIGADISFRFIFIFLMEPAPALICTFGALDTFLQHSNVLHAYRRHTEREVHIR